MQNNMLMEGLSTAATGILVVFIGLILLIFIIDLMRFFSREKPKTQPVQIPAPVAPVEEVAPSEDTALIAVIAAAVATMMQEEGAEGGFVVRRIRRIGPGRR